ncbi:MAG: ankyrin repeat domain-containing protein [Micavibrio sp.]|nr:ankyrin repeat domain-containing protein [Micavibrio sp.]
MSLSSAFNTAAQNTADIPLMEAVKFGNVAIVEMLLKQGASPNAPAGSAAPHAAPTEEPPAQAAPLPRKVKTTAKIDVATSKPVKALKTVRFNAPKKPKRDIKPL